MAKILHAEVSHAQLIIRIKSFPVRPIH